ncbi:ATP-binding protein [Mycobacterium sp. SMC-4]|uniref:sensor histidine kinase n=1 Tax=Mycobacterium sp. SMC-4 TaxID=2857059 RepID=UPI0021B30C1D|nr:ATP-binding protein [Mycobacterium sp. SMC-4]UXA19097.1 ATP-binding protein [Mycobacterium sp. SMC-4]
MAAKVAEWSDASRRQLGARAAFVGLLMRNTVGLGVSLVALADPASQAQPLGRALLAIMAAWSLYRLSTRSAAPGWLAVDYLMVLCICLAIPILAPDSGFHLSNSAPQAIAGTAVVSVSVSVAPLTSFMLASGVAAAYAYGAAGVLGWDGVASVTALYYFAVQWATASVIRYMLLGLASTIDRARNERQQVELAQQVNDAVRDYEHEQLALLHDTAASTLMMVGNGTVIDPQRLAAQARRDLALLHDGTWVAPPPWVNITAALRQCAEHITTPVEYDGLERLWLPGRTAQPVIAAVREVMTNVDRHAHASVLRVTVSDDAVTVKDDGVGFDVDAPRTSHGLRDSVVGRMQRCGGGARVLSIPGVGTTVELHLPTEEPVEGVAEDADDLTAPARTRYGLALTAYAVINLIITVPPANAVAATGLNAILGVAAGLSVLVALPRILYGRASFVGPAAIMLLVISIAQPLSVTAGSVIGYAHWAQGAIGWCVLPLILGVRTRVGVAILLGYWVTGNAVVIWQEHSSAALVNIGLGSASILGVQLFALIFYGLMRDAAADAHAETIAHQEVLARERVTSALRAEYQRRYADIVDSVVPLLDSLAQGHPVDRATQLRARAECHRLRALFDQASTFDHPLMQRIRPLVDAAGARHVDVTIDLSGALPDMTDSDIDTLTGALGEVLALAKTHARLVVTVTENSVEVSVVCDTDPDGPAQHRLDNADIVISGDQMWCLVRHCVDTSG